jgi:hypothetical protein
MQDSKTLLYLLLRKSNGITRGRLRPEGTTTSYAKIFSLVVQSVLQLKKLTETKTLSEWMAEFMWVSYLRTYIQGACIDKFVLRLTLTVACTFRLHIRQDIGSCLDSEIRQPEDCHGVSLVYATKRKIQCSILRKVLWNFQVTYSFRPHSAAVGSIQPLTEMCTKEFPWG